MFVINLSKCQNTDKVSKRRKKWIKINLQPMIPNVKVMNGLFRAFFM